MSVAQKNAWYAVSLSQDLASVPIQRKLFDSPVVLFRKSSGEVAALEDCCPHRNAPLSLGSIIGDEIQCRYHGFRFDCAGRCTSIPSQSNPVGSMRTRAYPVLVKYGIVWVWPGDPDKANPAALHDWPWFDNASWRSVISDFTIEAPVLTIIDNLMDLTHVQFVHKFGVNLPIHAASHIESWVDGMAIHYKRDLFNARFITTKDSVASDQYLEIGGSFLPPAIVITKGVTKYATTKEDAEGPHRLVFHALTPESAERTHYISLRSWNIYLSAEDIKAAQAEDAEAILEDKVIIEATYRNRKMLGDRAQERLVAADQLSVLARRKYAEIAKETWDSHTESALGFAVATPPPSLR